MPAALGKKHWRIGRRDQNDAPARPEVFAVSRPCPGPPAATFQHTGQIQITFLSGDVSDVGHPHGVGFERRGSVRQQIGRDRQIMVAVGRLSTKSRQGQFADR